MKNTFKANWIIKLKNNISYEFQLSKDWEKIRANDNWNISNWLDIVYFENTETSKIEPVFEYKWKNIWLSDIKKI